MTTRVIICFLMIYATLYGDTLTFVIPFFKPFTYVENGVFKGLGVERVETVLRECGYEIKIEQVPNYGRAVEEVRRGKSDGFFLATQNDERDSIAVFTHPIFINRWCWFVKEGSLLSKQRFREDKTLKIATPVNTNTHKWLKAEGYEEILPVNDLSSLVPLLLNDKVDAVFIAEEVFIYLMNDKKESVDSVKKYVQFSKPFGIYLAFPTIEKHEGIVEKLNTVIDSLYKLEE